MQIRRKLNLTVVATFAVAFLASVGGVSCAEKQKPPQTPTKRLGPEERILATGKAWREMTRTEGFVDQPDVSFIRVTDQPTLHLKPESKTALVDIHRSELIRSPDGREFHCTVEGAVLTSVGYAWRLEEAAVSVRMPAAALPRKCKERGFSPAFKQFPGLSATYVLRGDRLISVEPLTLRSVLLPVD